MHTAITKDDMVKAFLPIINKYGKRYRKISNIFARTSKGKELIVTFTRDGKETECITIPGDIIVRNIGGEEYVIKPEQLARRYISLDNVVDGWTEYRSIGFINGIEHKGDTFYFIASWDEQMVVKNGDIIANNGDNSVYRIACSEFEETYVLVQ
jgi:hypothetical protein